MYDQQRASRIDHDAYHYEALRTGLEALDKLEFS